MNEFNRRCLHHRRRHLNRSYILRNHRRRHPNSHRRPHQFD